MNESNDRRLVSGAQNGRTTSTADDLIILNEYGLSISSLDIDSKLILDKYTQNNVQRTARFSLSVPSTELTVLGSTGCCNRKSGIIY